MGYRLDNIALADYGIYVSSKTGVLDLLEGKEQYFTKYAQEGFQVTKRKGNEIEVKGFVIGDDLADFKTKLNNFGTALISAGTRTLTDLDGNDYNCFNKEGFKIDQVFIPGQVYARINFKMTIVAWAHWRYIEVMP